MAIQIWESLEYKLSSPENRQWGTNNGYPRIEMDSYGIKIRVKTNKGTECDILVKVSRGQIHSPEVLFLNTEHPLDDTWVVAERVWFPKETTWIYRLNGVKTPTAKSALWVSQKEILKNEDFKRNDDIQHQLHREKYDKYYKGVIAELRERLSPIAKKAIEDGLEDLFDKMKYDLLIIWFTENGFKKIPPIQEWNNAGIGGWNLTSGPDGYGHSCGTAVDILWDKKEFYKYGWSSDD